VTTAVTTPAASRPAASSGSLLETSPGPGHWGRDPGSARNAGGPAAGTQLEALSPGPGVGRSRTVVTGPPARAEGRAGTAGPGAGGQPGRRGSCHSLPVSAVTESAASAVTQHCQARSGTRSGCHTITVTVSRSTVTTVRDRDCVRLSAAATALRRCPQDRRTVGPVGPTRAWRGGAVARPARASESDGPYSGNRQSWPKPPK
jgi:hypothetical protein